MPRPSVPQARKAGDLGPPPAAPVVVEGGDQAVSPPVVPRLPGRGGPAPPFHTPRTAFHLQPGDVPPGLPHDVDRLPVA